MEKPIGHYVVTQGLGDASMTMIAWYDSTNFYLAGSHTPYTKSSFASISENPLALDITNNIKATTW